MGGDLGEIFYLLEQNINNIRINWADFVALYGTNKQRIDLLNEAASAFFANNSSLMWRFVVIEIAKITDSPNSGAGKDNLTIKILPDKINDSDKKLALQKLVELSLQKCSFCREWRNKVLAHSDLSIASGKNIVMLEPVNKSKIDDAVQSLFDIARFMNAEYLNTELADDIISHGNAEALLWAIHSGIEFERLKKDRAIPNDLSLEKDLPIWL